MAHQISEYLKYVSSVTVDNGGAGYSADIASLPTITITGGGGTGATATASVLDNSIVQINITNKGSGYTSIPTVTATDSVGGTGAVLSAKLGSAIASPTEYEEKGSIGVKYSVPEFIRDDYTQFLAFIEKYYEHMDADGNPVNLLLNKRYVDLDEINDTELNKRALELAKDFPQLLQADRKTLLKKIKNIYESKGSVRSIKAYFKLLYNEEVDVYSPSKNILRASDGIWLQDRYVFVTAGYDNFDVQNLSGTLADLIYYETIGSITLPRIIPITIPVVSERSYTSPQVYALQIKLPAGITSIPGPGDGAAATATISGGIVTNIEVTNGGLQYTAAPNVVLSGAGSGTGFSGRAVVSNGVVTSIVRENDGTGYTDGSYSLSFDTSSVRTVIVDRGASPDEANIKAYLGRCISSVSASPYDGTRIARRMLTGTEYKIVSPVNTDFTLYGAANNDVGTIFTATGAPTETGTTAGIVLKTGTLNAAFSIGEVYRVNQPEGNNNGIIRIQAIDSKNAPKSFSVIDPGAQYTEGQFNIGIGSSSRETVILTITTGYLFVEEGKFKDDRGKLSDANRIQDNYRYQAYSYIIKSTMPESSWKKRFKEIMHPAGMEVFGDLIIKNNVGFGPFFTIEAEGLHLFEFKTEDIVTSPDVIEIVVEWYRDFADIPSTTDTEKFDFGKNLSDVATTNDEYIDDSYVEEDYLPFGYLGAGVFKLVNKVLNTQAAVSDSVNTEVSFLRTFAESLSTSEYFAVHMELPVTETLTTSDLFQYLYDHGLSVVDTVSLSDDYDESAYVETGYLPEFYVGPGVYKVLEKSISNILTTSSAPVINTTKPLTDSLSISEAASKLSTTSHSDSATTSDSGTINGPQDYAPTYFFEDYVTGVTLGTF